MFNSPPSGRGGDSSCLGAGGEQAEGQPTAGVGQTSPGAIGGHRMPTFPYGMSLSKASFSRMFPSGPQGRFFNPISFYKVIFLRPQGCLSSWIPGLRPELNSSGEKVQAPRSQGDPRIHTPDEGPHPLLWGRGQPGTWGAGASPHGAPCLLLRSRHREAPDGPPKLGEAVSPLGWMTWEK